jgi:RNA polymerase sigma-70 factor (ECF subfamily)
LAKNHFNTAYVRHHSNDYYDETLIDKLENSTLSPEELLVKQETLKSIAEAFTQLPQEYQITLILRFYSELSLQEIATTLDIPLGTVKSRLSVGTQRLRNLLIEVKEGID